MGKKLPVGEFRRGQQGKMDNLFALSGLHCICPFEPIPLARPVPSRLFNHAEMSTVVSGLGCGRQLSPDVVVGDQSPEDELVPLCRELNIGVIARVPLDEGSIGG